MQVLIEARGNGVCIALIVIERAKCAVEMSDHVQNREGEWCLVQSGMTRFNIFLFFNY